MYDAKGAGRARYVFFTNEIDERAVERLALETDLRHALNREELSLRFQPQLDIQKNQAACAEALLRWTHPRRGTVWLGTGHADLVLAFDPSSEVFTAYPLPTRGALIRHIDVDERDGSVWVAYGASPGIPGKILRIQP